MNSQELLKLLDRCHTGLSAIDWTVGEWEATDYYTFFPVSARAKDGNTDTILATLFRDVRDIRTTLNEQIVQQLPAQLHFPFTALVSDDSLRLVATACEKRGRQEIRERYPKMKGETLVSETTWPEVPEEAAKARDNALRVVEEAAAALRQFIASEDVADFDKLLGVTPVENEEAIKTERTDELRYDFPARILEEDMTRIVQLTYDEALTDYSNACYLSAIAMCGKVIETVITDLYVKVHAPHERKDDLGFDALLNRLKAKGYTFPGLKEQMELINEHRNKAVHHFITVPTGEDALGIISLTKGVLIKVAIAVESYAGTAPGGWMGRNAEKVKEP